MNRVGLPSLLAATLVIHLALIQPNHPEALGWGALTWFPLELPAILLSLLAFGGTRPGKAFRIAVVTALLLLCVLRAADFVSYSALSRGFNPVTDLSLVEAFARLLIGSLGVVLANLAILGAGLVILCAAVALWWATGVWSRLALPRSAVIAAIPVALLTAGVAAAEVGKTMGAWALPFSPPGTAFAARVGVERVDLVRTTLAELRAFRAEVDQDPFADKSGLFEAIDRDVLVIFVESYGRTSFDTPLYAEQHRATLFDFERRLSALGLAMQSGFLSSPTQGGQSWLTHATFSNGLWIDNQVSYAAALSSGRRTLYHYAADAGFRTATVMPQITLDWPEVSRMGFEDVLVAADLSYKGLPFNWVTMPDQFTLAALDRLVLSDSDPRQRFVQIALASSHAPWVPVPRILPWDEIGDGTVFNDMARAGDPPEVVWRDRDRVRSQYRDALDYALNAVFEYVVLHAEDPPLILVIGDHQAAEFIALDDRAEVPIHVVGPDHLVTPLKVVAPSSGLLPAADAPVIAMDNLRDILLNAFLVSPGQSVGN